jgi:hypothetical protein
LRTGGWLSGSICIFCEASRAVHPTNSSSTL